MKLQPFNEEALPAMLELLTDSLVKQTYMLPDYAAKEDAIPLFRRLMQLSRDPHHFVRGIFAEDQLVGFLNDVQIHEGSIELGYVISPSRWGKGYATEALKMAVSTLFQMGYREILAGAFSENTASIRVMEKAGMVPMAKQDQIEYRGKVHTCLYFHIFK